MLKRILLFIISALVLSGCTIKSPEEITFSSWGSITEVQVLNQIITNFEKENPDVKINFMHIPQNYFQKLHLLFASNTAPDVIFINNLYLPLYASQLENLSAKVEEKDFYKQSIDSLRYDGKLLAIPRDISNLVFYVNTEIIEKPNSEWTLDDLLHLSQEAHNKGVFGISFEEDLYWMLPYLSYYGEVFDKNYIPSNSKSLIFYKNLRDKYNVAPTKAQIGSSTLAQMFLDEKIGLYLSGRWMFPKIREKATFNWTIVNFPYGKSPQPCDSSGWAISKDSKHKDTALRFIKYLSSEESAKYFAQTGLIVPARIKTSQILNNDKHNEKIFLEIIEKSKKTQVTKDYKKLLDDFNSKNF